MAGYPLFTHATVLSTDAGRHSLHVVLASGQVPASSIRVVTHGPADAVTVSHKPLPRPGTRGLVCFVGGDPRNGIWLGSYYGAGNDALTTDTDPNLEISSHWSGAYDMMDGEGRWIKSFPDGSFIQVSDTVTKPQLSRHVINQDQSRSLVAFTDSARIPNPPTARHIVINHASGASVHIDPTGDVTVTSAGSSPCIIAVNASGAISVTAPSTVTFTTPVVAVSGNLTVGTGASGTFATNGGVNVTVRDGIVTNIF